jgi:hypothetical protein
LGADPNTIFGDQTLAHKFKEVAELEALISQGFTKFNHPNSAGDHALISLAKLHNPRMLQLLLGGGSFINHQNHARYSALHLVVKQLIRLCPFTDDGSWRYGLWNQILDCIKVLFKNGANPSLRYGFCKCACSTSGCNAIHLLLRGKRYDASNPKNIWIVDYVNLVKECIRLKAAKQCLLEIVRFSKFQELELTHTCCRESGYGTFMKNLEDDEVEEIMDEERQIIETLENEIQDIEKSLEDDLDQPLLNAIFLLCLYDKPRSVSYASVTCEVNLQILSKDKDQSLSNLYPSG